MKVCNTYWVELYIAGPIEQATQLLRKRFADEGNCVSIYPTKYIYSMGEETGYVVKFINYPRLPKAEEEIFKNAKEIADQLLIETGQGSYTLVTPSESYFISRRKGDKE